MIDLHGATWMSRSEYKLQAGARRYEFYERDFAAVVRGGSRAHITATALQTAYCKAKQRASS